MLRQALLSVRVSRRSARFASTLVLAEHTNAALASSTLSAVTAARALGRDVSLIYAGFGRHAR